MQQLQLPSAEVLDRLPAGGWAVLLVIVLGIVISAGVQVLRLVLDQRQRKAHNGNGNGHCKYPPDLADKTREAALRQPIFAAEQMAAIGRFGDGVERLIDAMERLTDGVREVLAEARARDRRSP